MSVLDLMRQADREDNPQLAGKVVKFLQHRYRCTYRETVEIAGRAGVSAQRWEELMYAVDSNHDATHGRSWR